MAIVSRQTARARLRNHCKREGLKYVGTKSISDRNQYGEAIIYDMNDNIVANGSMGDIMRKYHLLGADEELAKKEK